MKPLKRQLVVEATQKKQTVFELIDQLKLKLREGPIFGSDQTLEMVVPWRICMSYHFWSTRIFWNWCITSIDNWDYNLSFIKTSILIHRISWMVLVAIQVILYSSVDHS